MTKPISIALIATSLSLLASGCSLRYDFESECSAPEDCYRFDNSGTFYTCESNRCVQEADVECRADEDCESGEACEQNRCASTTPLDMGMDQDVPSSPPYHSALSRAAAERTAKRLKVVKETRVRLRVNTRAQVLFSDPVPQLPVGRIERVGVGIHSKVIEVVEQGVDCRL